nr:MFS transporter [Rubrobacter marinus]
MPRTSSSGGAARPRWLPTCSGAPRRPSPSASGASGRTRRPSSSCCGARSSRSSTSGRGGALRVHPELYPTAARGSGAGWAAGVGRIGGIVGPYLVGLMLGGGTFGPGAVFVVFAAVLLVIALDVLVLGEETMGRTLDEISGEARAGAS